ncbi:MAG: hypothetical protein IJ467_00470 [Bacteroidaceae bacterium]|nr:hypothetical protein [Bacteroidaceae bacterium]
MKNLYYLVAFVAMLGTSSISAQNRVIRILQNGNVLQSYPVEMVDSIIIDNVIDAPTNLTATIDNNNVVLNWSGIEGATYDVYRSADGTNYTQLATNLTSDQYVDSTPIAGTNYYKIKARVNGYESELCPTPAIITMTDSSMESGLYLGVMGFNSSIITQPIAFLNSETKTVYDAFVDGLGMKKGTVLCSSVDEAIDALQTASLPTDISTVAVVTFTDGLDQGSLMLDDRFESDDDYLEAIKQRISNEIIAGDTITAFSVGIRGSDVKNEDEIEKFHRTLKLLASSDEKATEVQNMAEVNAKFQEIAEQLNRSTNLQTVTLKMPGISNGTRIRFTFDNVSSAELSELYIEGTFNLRSRTLTDVEYHGMTSTSGTTITGVTEGIFVSFTFEGIHTEGNKLLSMDFVDEWYLVSTSSWQINSEFDRDDQPEIINEQSSAVIMLVLDCSSSLGDQFPMVQANAKSFIATLCSSSNSGESGEGETPEKPLPTLYSTTPVDLSLAVSYNGVRYYLTQEQYAKANLSDAIIEGVTVITGDESFIIAMENEPTDYMASSYARKYYGDNLPSKSQGEVISARWSYINNAIKAFGGTEFSTKFWTSYYTSDYDYYTYAGGGNIGYYYYYGDRGEFPVRLVYPTTVATPIVWRDPLDLSLAVRKDSVMTYYTQTEWADVIDKTEYEIVGVSVSTDTIKFIVAMQNEPADDMLASNAREYYGDNLPTESQGRVISARWSYINNAIKAFGGTEFSTRFWTSYYSGSYSYCTRAGGGSLLSRYDENEYKHPVRLVYPFEEPTKE